MLPEAVNRTLATLWPLLENLNNKAAIAGGIALSYWGNPRSTQDVDVAILSDDWNVLQCRLLAAGFSQKQDAKSLGLFELVQFTFEPPETFIDVEVDLLLGTGEYCERALSRAAQVELPGIASPVRVLAREDLVIQKLYANRLIDQADVLNLFEFQWHEMDQEYLERWTEEVGVRDEFYSLVERYRESK